MFFIREDGIVRLSMDGTGSRIVVYGGFFFQLVIDYNSQILYWRDGQSILASNTDGSNTRVVVSDFHISTLLDWLFFETHYTGFCIMAPFLQLTWLIHSVEVGVAMVVVVGVMQLGSWEMILDSRTLST